MVAAKTVKPSAPTQVPYGSSALALATPSPIMASPTIQEGVAQQTTQLMVAPVSATRPAPAPDAATLDAIFGLGHTRRCSSASAQTVAINMPRRTINSIFTGMRFRLHSEMP